MRKNYFLILILAFGFSQAQSDLESETWYLHKLTKDSSVDYRESFKFWSTKYDWGIRIEFCFDTKYSSAWDVGSCSRLSLQLPELFNIDSLEIDFSKPEIQEFVEWTTYYGYQSIRIGNSPQIAGSIKFQYKSEEIIVGLIDMTLTTTDGKTIWVYKDTRNFLRDY